MRRYYANSGTESVEIATLKAEGRQNSNWLQANARLLLQRKESRTLRARLSGGGHRCQCCNGPFIVLVLPAQTDAEFNLSWRVALNVATSAKDTERSRVIEGEVRVGWLHVIEDV